jgi:hypothetical protein
MFRNSSLLAAWKYTPEASKIETSRAQSKYLFFPSPILTSILSKRLQASSLSELFIKCRKTITSFAVNFLNKFHRQEL